MSGVEVAGLVLGALPLLLAGLQFYSQGIAVTKRYWKYREEVNSLLSDLQAEYAVYQNSIETLLLGVVDAKDVMAFLADPGGKLWRTSSFERRLKQRLSTSYDPYLATVVRLQDAADAFKEKLKLDYAGQVCDCLPWRRGVADILQPQFAQPQTFKVHYKRLKFSLNKRDYAELMIRIKNANTILHRLTFQRQNIESQQCATKISVPDFRNINERARGFYSILSSGWTCPCQSSHAISLRLEPRIGGIVSDDDADDEEHQFHILFQYGYQHPIPSAVNISPWIWDEAYAYVTREQPASNGPASGCHLHTGKGVRFASQATRAVKAALKPEPNLQPIKDLCSAIQTLQKPQRDVCLRLLAREIAKQEYELRIYLTEMLPQNTEQWSVSTLRKALRRGRRFPKRDRVRLAVVLASSVLQLHETPWLDDDWGIDNIYFVERPGFAAYEQPFVSRGLDSRSSGPRTAIPKHLERMIRNQPLFALGVALIELWYGESLSELHEDEDGPQNSPDPQSGFLTKFNTADRLADELADDAGTKYSDAVRRCIRCDFSLRVNKLEDVQFQRAVFHGVVAKLKESYDFMS